MTGKVQNKGVVVPRGEVAPKTVGQPQSEAPKADAPPPITHDVSDGQSTFKAVDPKHASWNLTDLRRAHDGQMVNNAHAVVDILGTEKGLEEFSPFFDAVLKAIDAEDFEAFVKSLDITDQTDVEQLRKEMFDERGKVLPNVVFKYKRLIGAARKQNADMRTRVKDLLGEKPVGRYLDVGEPGGALQGLNPGEGYALHDTGGFFKDKLLAEGATPKIIPFSLRPEQLAEVPDGSLDTVLIGPGLHHFPVERLENFVDVLITKMKPGGTMLLQEHDAPEGHTKQLATSAHVTYNMATGETHENDGKEYRNFHGHPYWTELLEKKGLKRTDDGARFIQNDTSRNGLMRFDKPETVGPVKRPPAPLAPMTDEQLVRFANRQPGYKQDLAQTKLTAIEWLDVDRSLDLAKHVKTEQAHTFPYFEAAGQYWQVFGKAMAQADTHPMGFVAMDSFIALAQSSFTAGRGVLALPYRVFAGSKQPENPSPVQKHNIELEAEYADSLAATPFYLFKWGAHVKQFWSELGQSAQDSLQKKGLVKTALSRELAGDAATVVARTLGGALKATISAPIAMFYTQPENAAPATIGLIIKGATDKLEDLKAAFKAETGLDLTVRASGVNTHYLDVPRYVPFNQFLLKLGERGFSPVEIAGNKKINLHVSVPSYSEQDLGWLRLRQIPPALSGVAGAEVDFKYDMPSRADKSEVMLTVDIERMNEVLGELKKRSVDVVRFHDY